VQIVLEQHVSSLGLFGRPERCFASVDLPVSSLQWTVYVPARNMYSVLESDLPPQVLAGEAELAPAVVRLDVVETPR